MSAFTVLPASDATSLTILLPDCQYSDKRFAQRWVDDALEQEHRRLSPHDGRCACPIEACHQGLDGIGCRLRLQQGNAAAGINDNGKGSRGAESTSQFSGRIEQTRTGSHPPAVAARALRYSGAASRGRPALQPIAQRPTVTAADPPEEGRA